MTRKQWAVLSMALLLLGLGTIVGAVIVIVAILAYNIISARTQKEKIPPDLS